MKRYVDYFTSIFTFFQKLKEGNGFGSQLLAGGGGEVTEDLQ